MAKLSQTKRTAETVAEYKAKNKDDQSAIKDVGGFVLGQLTGKSIDHRDLSNHKTN
ncbi:hypothetical protein [uncultured Allobaculum sp.]|nr:hypothetical protein [uncultured Allobaculum sp.]